MTGVVPNIQLVDARGNPMASYDAAKPSPYRKQRGDYRAANPQVNEANRDLRAHARHLYQNRDMVKHAFRTLVNNIVGPAGITVEPQPRSASGKINKTFARQLSRAWKDWQKKPEVTHRLDWAAAQRMECLTWLRDGDALAQFVEGAIPTLNHGTRVPFSLELLEPDFLPMGYSDTAKNIVQGIQRNAWGQRTFFHLHKYHPGETRSFAQYNDLKTVSADRMLHVALVDRLHQERGVTLMASIIERLEDIGDYDESERIAAKIAASLGAYIRKGNGETFDVGNYNGKEYRELKFQPGMIIDDLGPGEEIGMIDSKRPNPNMDGYLQTQHRFAAGGFGISASSFTKRYDGTYSAQRQELVEQWIHYAVMQAEFSSQFVQPVWERFVKMAVLSGEVKLPRGIDIESANDAMYIGPQMPWIDPYKEELALALMEGNLHASALEIIRRRGKNPADVLEQQKHWEDLKKDAGLQTQADKELTADEKQFGENAA